MAKWEKHADDIVNGSPSTLIKKILLIGVPFIVIMGIVSFILGIFGETAQVAKEEFGARASLKKYEWFKNASFQLEKKLADINVYETNIKEMKTDMGDRSNWDRTDKEQMNQWKSELSGIKFSYNNLVAEYNAQSSKFNWSLYNTMNLPTTYKTK